MASYGLPPMIVDRLSGLRQNGRRRYCGRSSRIDGDQVEKNITCMVFVSSYYECLQLNFLFLTVIGRIEAVYKVSRYVAGKEKKVQPGKERRHTRLGTVKEDITTAMNSEQLQLLRRYHFTEYNIPISIIHDEPA